MTTLRTRWEKQDYTGVTAEVPLGHCAHPRISQTQHIPLTFVFPELPACLSVSCASVNHRGAEIMTLLKTRRRFWANCSLVFGTRQIPNLAHIFNGMGRGLAAD